MYRRFTRIVIFPKIICRLKESKIMSAASSVLAFRQVRVQGTIFSSYAASEHKDWVNLEREKKRGERRQKFPSLMAPDM